MHTVQTTRLYSFEDLRGELSRVRPKGMPKSTLYNWLRELKLIPNSNGYYEQDDLDVLTKMSQFLTRCPSIEKFKQANNL
jgi:hypothetical protein